jgi:hypothetical protein
LFAGITALGGAVFLGLTWNKEARGEGERALALTEVFTHPELGFSFRYPEAFRLATIPQGERSELEKRMLRCAVRAKLLADTEF